jgi:predicted O-methyltransferase YrrM
MEFERVAAAVRGIPYMGPENGRRLYDHIRETGATNVLELGTAHGVSASYMAAAIAANGGGSLITVDTNRATPEPSAQSVVAKAGLDAIVDTVRAPDSSYTWWLKDRIAARSTADGNCEPEFDFCYLDGAHNWTIDGFAALLVEKLLRPQGWLLLDDLNWSYASYGGAYEIGQSPEQLFLSPAEVAEPHMKLVYDLIVRQHPAFTEFRVENANWGWARKAPGEPRTYRVENTTSLGAIALGQAVKVRNRLLARRRA